MTDLGLPAATAAGDDSNRVAGPSSIIITRRQDRSAYMFVIQHLVKLLGTRLAQPGKRYPEGSPQLTAPASVRKKCRVHERQIAGIYVYDLIPHEIRLSRAQRKEERAREQEKQANGLGGEHSQPRKLYYFAGGGWQAPPSGEHWALCAELACRLASHAAVAVVSYPLAPATPAPRAFPALMALYRAVLAEAAEVREEVVLAGDSAGGNLVLCMTLAGLAEDEQQQQHRSESGEPPEPCPAVLLAISPSTDLRRGNPEIPLVAKHDPLLSLAFVKSSADAWRGEWDAADPRVSPLLGDVALLAKRDVRVHGVVGRYDLLMPDAVLFREACAEQGVRGEWLDWDKQMHCFPLTFKYRLPESGKALEWIVEVMGRS